MCGPLRFWFHPTDFFVYLFIFFCEVDIFVRLFMLQAIFFFRMKPAAKNYF